MIQQSIALFLLGLSAVAFAQTPSTKLVRVQLDHYPEQMRMIQAQSIDLAGVNLKAKQADLLVDAVQADWLNQHHFKMVKVVASRAMSGPDSRYQNPTKVESALKQFAAAYPTLAKVSSIGKSLEGRDIWAIRITKDVDKNDPSKPHVFFNSMHHAREVMTSEVGLDIVDQLLSGFGKDEKITHWLESYVVDVIPMFNVDGNNLVWTSDSMWRKNARGGYGVDINRNYPYAWNSCHGSSGSKYAQDFHGDSAASEVETKVMMDFVSRIKPVFSISYHSYSEIVIYPFGCEGQHVPTKEVVEKIGRELASKIKTDDGKGTYTPGTAPELLYSVDGGDIDWLYAVAQVIPYVIEVNSSSQGFQPAYNQWRDKTVRGQRAGWQYLLERMDGSSLYGQVKDSNGKGLSSAKLHIQALGGSFKQDYLVKDQGYFNVILNPGKYEISVDADGFRSEKKTVTIGETRFKADLTLNTLQFSSK
jgi:hypothetical protein